MKEEIQNQTLDKGWKAMSELLDREMPVERRKRRFIWWWFLLLLMPIAALGGWYLVNNNRLPEFVTPPPVNTKPMATNPGSLQPAQSPVSGSNTAEVFEKGTISAQTHLKQKPSNPNPSSIPNAAADNMAFQPGPTMATSIAHETDGSHGQIQHNDLTPEHAPTAMAKPWSALMLSSKPIQLLETRQQLPALASIPAKAGQPIEPLKRKKLAIGAGIYATTESFSTINGIAAGVQAKWALNQRWAIRSGLFVSGYNPTMKTQPVASLQAEKYSDATDLEFGIEDAFGNVLTPSTTLDEPVLIPISSMYLLETPLLASYQFSRRWSIQAGATTACLLRAKSSASNYSGNYVLALQSEQARTSVSDLATAQLDQWRFDAQLGATFALNKKLECSIAARLPVGSISSKANKARLEALNNNGLNPSLYDPIVARSTLNQPMFSIGLSYYAW